MTAELSLLPCPFCAGPARIESSAMWIDLICDHEKTCILDGDAAEMSYQNAAGAREQMLAKWNRRSVQQAPQASVEDAPERARMAGEAVRNVVHGILGPGFHMRLADLDFATIINAAMSATQEGK